MQKVVYNFVLNMKKLENTKTKKELQKQDNNI